MAESSRLGTGSRDIALYPATPPVTCSQDAEGYWHPTEWRETRDLATACSTCSNPCQRVTGKSWLPESVDTIAAEADWGAGNSPQALPQTLAGLRRYLAYIYWLAMGIGPSLNRGDGYGNFVEQWTVAGVAAGNRFTVYSPISLPEGAEAPGQWLSQLYTYGTFVPYDGETDGHYDMVPVSAAPGWTLKFAGVQYLVKQVDFVNNELVLHKALPDYGDAAPGTAWLAYETEAFKPWEAMNLYTAGACRHSVRDWSDSVGSAEMSYTALDGDGGHWYCSMLANEATTGPYTWDCQAENCPNFVPGQPWRPNAHALAALVAGRNLYAVHTRNDGGRWKMARAQMASLCFLAGMPCPQAFGDGQYQVNWFAGTYWGTTALFGILRDKATVPEGDGPGCKEFVSGAWREDGDGVFDSLTNAVGDRAGGRGPTNRLAYDDGSGTLATVQQFPLRRMPTIAMANEKDEALGPCENEVQRAVRKQIVFEGLTLGVDAADHPMGTVTWTDGLCILQVKGHDRPLAVSGLRVWSAFPDKTLADGAEVVESAAYATFARTSFDAITLGVLTLEMALAVVDVKDGLADYSFTGCGGAVSVPPQRAIRSEVCGRLALEQGALIERGDSVLLAWDGIPESLSSSRLTVIYAEAGGGSEGDGAGSSPNPVGNGVVEWWNEGTPKNGFRRDVVRLDVPAGGAWALWLASNSLPTSGISIASVRSASVFPPLGAPVAGDFQPTTYEVMGVHSEDFGTPETPVVPTVFDPANGVVAFDASGWDAEAVHCIRLIDRGGWETDAEENDPWILGRNPSRPAEVMEWLQGAAREVKTFPVGARYRTLAVEARVRKADDSVVQLTTATTNSGDSGTVYDDPPFVWETGTRADPPSIEQGTAIEWWIEPDLMVEEPPASTFWAALSTLLWGANDLWALQARWVGYFFDSAQVASLDPDYIAASHMEIRFPNAELYCMSALEGYAPSAETTVADIEVRLVAVQIPGDDGVDLTERKLPDLKYVGVSALSSVASDGLWAGVDVTDIAKAVAGSPGFTFLFPVPAAINLPEVLSTLDVNDLAYMLVDQYYRNNPEEELTVKAYRFLYTGFEYRNWCVTLDPAAVEADEENIPQWPTDHLAAVAAFPQFRTPAVGDSPLWVSVQRQEDAVVSAEDRASFDFEWTAVEGADSYLLAWTGHSAGSVSVEGTTHTLADIVGPTVAFDPDDPGDPAGVFEWEVRIAAVVDGVEAWNPVPATISVTYVPEA